MAKKKKEVWWQFWSPCSLDVLGKRLCDPHHCCFSEGDEKRAKCEKTKRCMLHTVAGARKVCRSTQKRRKRRCRLRMLIVKEI